MNTVAPADFGALIATDRVGPSARLEQVVCAGGLVAMMLFPIADMVMRTITPGGLIGAVEYTQHLALWVGFFGAVVAARQGRHLTLSTPAAIVTVVSRVKQGFVATLAATVSACLAIASWQFLASEADSQLRIGGWLSVTAAASVLPLAFALMAIHFLMRTAGFVGRATTLVATLTLTAAFHFLDGTSMPGVLLAALIGVLLFATALGLPIFVMLGGIALLLFHGDGVPAAALPVETYRLVVSPSIPAIPLFTLTGFVLASGGSANRLVRLFAALFGWLPGGTVVAATLVCAFMSAFTGASGVTILALGGLLLPALRASGNGESFSLGLITSTGSIGLLFPPSLAVILYGVLARVPVSDLFRAGALPGLAMVVAICVYGAIHSRRHAATLTRFDLREALAALWQARYELLLPLVVLVALFGGFATLIEAAAISACYVIFIEVFVHRELTLRRDLPRVLLRCATLLGGVFAIIGVAMGLTNFLVDSMVPMKLVAWIGAHVESRIVFLLLLNVLLLMVGCVMDIFSAIFVVLPLIIPASQLFHIDPLHLGLIFLLNLELGYLTPPVGMNLFLAAYRLDRPVAQISRSVLPFLGVLLAVLLLVTFVPLLVEGAD